MSGRRRGPIVARSLCWGVVVLFAIEILCPPTPEPNPAAPPRPTDFGALAFGTLIGGDDTEIGWALEVDAAESAYSAGTTQSWDFPVTSGAFQTRPGGSRDAYVAKLRSDGSALQWATFLGGDSGDGAGDIVVDDQDNVYVSGATGGGTTLFTGFPTTPGAFDGSHNGRSDGWVAKLSADGSRLLWSTYLGGVDGDAVRALTVAADGSVFVTGDTNSWDFPTTPGAFDRTCGTDGLCNDAPDDRRDGFVARISADGRSLLWSTFLGGDRRDEPWSIGLDAVGRPIVAGITNSSEFPVTPGAFQRTQRGSHDGFVTRLSTDGTRVEASTFLGGGGEDGVIASVDALGSVLFSGGTDSVDFPATLGAYQEVAGGDRDAVVGKLTPDLASLEWATYLGGPGMDGANGVQEYGGTIFVSGFTDSAGFPVTADAFDATFNGGATDGFLAVLNPAGTRLAYGTYLGGSGEDGSDHMVLSPSGTVYQGGRTSSPDFPVTAGAYDTVLNGTRDAYVVRHVITPPTNEAPTLAWMGEPDFAADGLHPETGTTATAFEYRVAYADPDGDPPTQMQVVLERPLGTVRVTATMNRTAWNGAPGDYATGAIYSFNTTLPEGTDWWYAFRASDGWDDATGAPTVRVDAPDVVVDLPPIAVARAAPTTVHMGEPVQFDATDSTDDLGIASFLWEFGDGSENSDPVTIHAYAARGTFQATVTVSDAAAQTDSDAVTIEVANRPPFAEAGPDRIAAKNTIVVLNGLASGDPDGDSIGFAWTQIAGPPVLLMDSDSATPTFVATPSGVLSFRLVVNDGWGGSAEATVNITVVDRAPVADAGPDRIVPKKAVVAVDGTTSSDPDGDLLTFAWSQSGGTTVTISGADTAIATFVPPASGVYAFELTVSDGFGGEDRDRVNVTATNMAPVADAGIDRTVAKRTVVVLSGSISDGDGDPLLVAWTQDSGPAVSLTGANATMPSFTPLQSGVYRFRLTVWDDDGGVGTDLVQVTATNAAPIADAGTDRLGRKNVRIELDGSRSFDPDDDVLNVAWSQTSGPLIVLQGDDTLFPSFIPTSAGTYGFRLTVRDGEGSEGSDDVSFGVWGLPPLAVLAANVSDVPVGVPVAFDASGSSDPDGVIVDYAFAVGGGLPRHGTTQGWVTSFQIAGTFRVSLTVTDDDGNTSVAEVTITVHARFVALPTERNWKPLVAAVFAFVLVMVGTSSARKRPWRGDLSRWAVPRAFAVASLPFVAVEVATGVVSHTTGLFAIPPLFGVGTLVDLAILIGGIAMSWFRLWRIVPPIR